MITNDSKITDMLIEYDFFERAQNSRGSFENAFIDNNDGTIADRTTGLMWQKNGSSKTLDNRRSKAYVKRLNKERFAGHSDWRMPTIEELASLLTRRRKSGVHMDPAFDNNQVSCWSADRSDIPSQYYSGAWIVSFKDGMVAQAIWVSQASADIGAGVYNKNTMNYVKAVRTDK